MCGPAMDPHWCATELGSDGKLGAQPLEITRLLFAKSQNLAEMSHCLTIARLSHRLLPCSRTAGFGVSPTMPRSWAAPVPIRSPTMTSAVAIPTRTRKGYVSSGFELRHHGDEGKPGSDRALGVMLAGLWRGARNSLREVGRVSLLGGPSAAI
jgi:hypothetical protein